MLKRIINFYVHMLFISLSASSCLAQDVQASHIHSKEGNNQNCRTCHTLQGEVKEGISDTCISCHESTVSLMGDTIRVRHVLPMNRHVINNPLTSGKYVLNIIQDRGRIYIVYQNDRLPLFGMAPDTATMECTTCHEPHNESGIPKMLRIDNRQGQLCDICHELSLVTLRSSKDIPSTQKVSFTDSPSLSERQSESSHDVPVLPWGQNASLFDVHMWPGSKCTICHISDQPEDDVDSLVHQDQSRLCESCHEGTVTIRPDHISASEVLPMKNHPIKFSPLDFDREKINHNIIREGGHFYVSGQTGKIPLFGETRESAVAECGTCHEPHGKSGKPHLPRIENDKGQLCLVCHITLESDVLSTIAF